MPLFVLAYVFPHDPKERLAVRPRHRAYLEELKAAGKLVAAGPWADDSGALLIYDVADEAELAALLANDPYTRAAVYGDRDVREWRPIIGGDVPLAAG